MADLILPGTATAGQVLSGQTFSAGANYNASGTMPNQGAVTLTPSGTGSVAIPAGYHNGSGSVSQVNVPAGNVLTGTTIASVAGTMANQGGMIFTPNTGNQPIPMGFHNGGGYVQGDANLSAANIIAGKSIFGITGSAPNIASNGGSVVYFFGEGITTWTSVTLSGSVSWNNAGYFLGYNNNATSGQQALYYPNMSIDVTGWRYVVAFFHDMFDNFSFCVSHTNGDTSNNAGSTSRLGNLNPTDAGPNQSQLFYADISALSGQCYVKLLGSNSGTSYGGGSCFAIVLMNAVY